MEVEIYEDFAVRCSVCEDVLQAVVVGRRDGSRTISVDPCDKCLNSAMADGEANCRMEAES